MDNVEALQVLLELVAEDVVDVLQPPVVRDIGPGCPEKGVKISIRAMKRLVKVNVKSWSM